MRIFLLGLVTVIACGGSGVGPVRFVNAPPVVRVDDRHDVPKKPEERIYLRTSYHFGSYYIQAVRGLSLTRERRSVGVNSFDEVPDSTWFTNRLGVRDVTPLEIERGPGQPSPELPFTIKSSKAGGRSFGFIAKDAKGQKFILKFDRKSKPEIETATDAIVGRLMWAFGYNVSADHVVYFKRSDLRLEKDAYTKTNNKKTPLTDAILDKQLEQITFEADGRIRAIASIFIEGKTIGGIARLGVRKDDPNDRIPHELRRDQRGQAPLFAWLSHSDMREDQTVDTWQEDPADKKVHYVVHYQIDFGNALDAALANQPYLGHEYDIDIEEVFASIFSIGLYRHGWETRHEVPIRGIGMYTTKTYNPGTWKPNSPGHFPLIFADRFDEFWGSKILIRFTRDQLAGAIKAGKLTDPKAVSYLLETLIDRQRMTASYWFERVNPIDEFTMDHDRVCFTDLALRHRLTTVTTRFKTKAFDVAGRELPASPEPAYADSQGHACITPVIAPGKEGYTILQVESSRGMPGTQIHLAIDPTTSKPRVIGIHRL